MKKHCANPLKDGLRRYLTPEQIQKLTTAIIGIAGAGGLGSNVAMLLARSGIENFIVIDHDIIEPSNLNRQHYWPNQLGLPKVDGLLQHLHSLNPDIRAQSHALRLEESNLTRHLYKAPIWIEALDDGAIKKIFVETALLNKRAVIAASGIAGYGGLPLCRRKIGGLIVVGDFQTGIDSNPPLAPRVMQAAAIMADCALEWILDGCA